MILTHEKRLSGQFDVIDISTFKNKVFKWASSYEICCYMDSNKGCTSHIKNYEVLIGLGFESQIYKRSSCAFEDLKTFYEKKKDWLFGFLTYDLKNDIERLSSNNQDQLDFPDMHFFQPSIVIEIKEHSVKIHATKNSPFSIFQEILDTEEDLSKSNSTIPPLQSRFSKRAYLEKVKRIKEHIIEGDIYEMNFCQEYYAEEAILDPELAFKSLNELAKAPFSCFYKLKDKFLLCASPERYLKKSENIILSQPIKGTIRRGKDEAEDLLLMNELFKSEKDRAENVMIVDLVRNDLAKNCKPGSVKVEELFGIYPFEQVFQMISTVKGTLKNDVHFIDAIKDTFPMGSMTGAPKIMAMQLIEKYERTKRGLYSGAVGYIRPDGDFDFNVVIRSILYNEATKYLSFQVGGAIVYDSKPEDEYEECLLKAMAILKVLGN